MRFLIPHCDVAAQQRAAGKDTTGALGYAAREAIKEDFTKKRDINKGTSEDQQQLAFEAMQRMVDNKLTENLETARLSLLGGQSLLSREVKKNLEKLQQEFLPPEMRSIPDTSTPVEETTTTTALTPQAQRRANHLPWKRPRNKNFCPSQLGKFRKTRKVQRKFHICTYNRSCASTIGWSTRHWSTIIKCCQ
jgi:hypothetical protein